MRPGQAPAPGGTCSPLLGPRAHRPPAPPAPPTLVQSVEMASYVRGRCACVSEAPWGTNGAAGSGGHCGRRGAQVPPALRTAQAGGSGLCLLDTDGRPPRAWARGSPAIPAAWPAAASAKPKTLPVRIVLHPIGPQCLTSVLRLLLPCGDFYLQQIRFVQMIYFLAKCNHLFNKTWATT